MKGWFYVASIAAGIIYYVYQTYSSRQPPHDYGSGARSNDEEEYEFVSRSDTPSTSQALPGRDENCCICLEGLYKKNSTRKYCLISLPRCGHWFHQKCALRLLEYHPMCPVCRVKIDHSMLRNTPVRIIDQTEGDVLDITDYDSA